MRGLLGLLVVMAGCTGLPTIPHSERTVPEVAARGEMPAAVQSEPQLSGREIIRRAHEAAGGETFVRPKTLFLKGYNIVRRGDTETLWDRYAMWRVFADEKTNAHTATGKVRIEGWSGDNLAMLLSFDGETTYNQDGRLDDQSANAMWNANFGFGAIRNALDEGWTQTRQADRLIDGQPAFMVRLTDPSGGQTLFGIAQADSALLYVGFDTERGWHERRYSHYFETPGLSWKQAGRVRLFYDGIKTNEAIWTDVLLDHEMDASLFVVEEAPAKPSF